MNLRLLPTTIILATVHHVIHILKVPSCSWSLQMRNNLSFVTSTNGISIKQRWINYKTSPLSTMKMNDGNRSTNLPSLCKVALSMSVAISVTSCYLSFPVSAMNRPHRNDAVAVMMSVPLVRRHPTSTATTTFLSSTDHTTGQPTNGTSQSTIPSTKTTEKKHESKGDKLAKYLKSLGIPPSLAIVVISALPILELRAGIPTGILLFKLPPLKTLLLSIIGNLLPLPFILLLLKLPFVQSIARPILSRARGHAQSIGNSASRALALALFVGVPLPGTGAWTGTLIAFVLGMNFRDSLLALTTGIVMAGCIMTILCELGWIGAVVAGCFLSGMGVLAIYKAVKGVKNNSAENSVLKDDGIIVD